MEAELTSLFYVLLIAGLAPIASRLLHRFQVPAVVFMLAGGVLIGQEGLGLADPDHVELLSTIGLSFLFLLAGYELELDLMKQPPGRRALIAWLAADRERLAASGDVSAAEERQRRIERIVASQR